MFYVLKTQLNNLLYPHYEYAFCVTGYCSYEVRLSSDTRSWLHFGVKGFEVQLVSTLFRNFFQWIATLSLSLAVQFLEGYALILIGCTRFTCK
jgi:hypothetical protein